MSKQQSKAVERKDAPAELLAQVKEAIEGTGGNRNTYSSHRVYLAHNAVFDLKDKITNCPSCVMRRVTNLKKWYGPILTKEQSTESALETAIDTSEPNYTNPEGEAYQGPKEGSLRLTFGEDAMPIDFTAGAEDPTKGTVALANGKGVKAGTYETEDGGTLVVSVGNKATYTELT